MPIPNETFTLLLERKECERNLMSFENIKIVFKTRNFLRKTT